MKTPIYDFVKSYSESKSVRMHMPGHKGAGDIERFDITEISGADSLYEAKGIIAESERNAGMLYGADTFYSAEGSSLSIRAMLYLTLMHAVKNGQKCRILAARNVHKSFVYAVGLLDIDVDWLPPSCDSYLSGGADANSVKEALMSAADLPTAVYLTSPDYLGKISDIKGIAEVCHSLGVLLLVDNAHGAYLKFLEPSRHPIDLGADAACDSAHKTLPALTGGAYLHISKNAPAVFAKRAKEAMALFGSTSPSYLILASLDRTNAYLADGYAEKLSILVDSISLLKEKLISSGYALYGDEPMKITLDTKAYGYFGYELSEMLERCGIVPEFSDPDHLVLMLAQDNSADDLLRLERALLGIEKKEKISEQQPSVLLPKRAMRIRDALFADSDTVAVSESLGRVLSAVTVGCPPAVPILVSGEIVDEASLELFRYYGINEVSVIKV